LGGGIGEEFLPAILIPAGEKTVITTIALGDIHDHSILSQFVQTSHLVISIKHYSFVFPFGYFNQARIRRHSRSILGEHAGRR
jgi:hypothetical protein